MNHHAENVIPQILLRVQAKQEQREALQSVQKGDSQVSHVAKELQPFPGTTFKFSFIRGKEDSWQLHLQRISPFLVAGQGVWWTRTPSGFHFYDGDEDCSHRSDNLKLLHHRHHSILNVEDRRDKSWTQVITNRVPLPAFSIKHYTF